VGGNAARVSRSA